MIYEIEFSEDFNNDVAKLRKSEPKAFEKVKKFIAEIKEHPRTGTGHPEQLKHYKEETWSLVVFLIKIYFYASNRIPLFFAVLNHVPEFSAIEFYSCFKITTRHISSMLLSK